ncbi:hypothetical protein PT974_00769 [Cladobotryum mycophilum]|uniref:Uncharacterized protein n=1 Tax=Cladobotryum mycophilum TaxID=491253 RepID=A0ABR0T317_9HYPO
MVRSIALLALSGAAMAAVQSTTVSILMPYADPTAIIHASVITAGPQATTYAVTCPEYHGGDDDNSGCGMADGTATVVQGPSTYAFAFSDVSEDVTVSEQFACTAVPLKNRNVLDCAVTGLYVDEDGSSQIKTSTALVNDFDKYVMPVTVTAGLQKLGTATPGATIETTITQTTGSATPTGSVTSFVTSTASGSTGVKATHSATITTTSAVSSGLPSSNSTSGPHSTNAAVPVNSQNALIAGFAAIIGGVLLL